MLKNLSKERYDEGNKKLEEIELKYCITKDYRDGIIEEMKDSKYTVYKNQNQGNKIMFIHNGDFKKVCEDMINLGFADYIKDHYLPHYAKIYKQIMEEREHKEEKIEKKPFSIKEVIREARRDKQDIQKEIEEKPYFQKEEVKPYFQKKEEVKSQKKIEEEKYIPEKKIEEKKEERQEKYLTSIQPVYQNHEIKSRQITKEDIGQWMDGVEKNAENRNKNANKIVENELNPYFYPSYKEDNILGNYKVSEYKPEIHEEGKNKSTKIYPSMDHRYFGTGSALNQVNTKMTYEEVQKRTEERKKEASRKKDHDNSIEEIELKKEAKNIKSKNQKVYPSNSYEEESSANIAMKKEKDNSAPRRNTWFDNLKGCCCPCISFN